MIRVLAIDQPFDLAVSLEMGQAFRWRRVGDEDVRKRDWGCPSVYWRTGGGWYSGVLRRQTLPATGRRLGRTPPVAWGRNLETVWPHRPVEVPRGTRRQRCGQGTHLLIPV